MMNRAKQVATSIVQKLFDEGYIAYFAGGWVRDLLLGVASDEIDIATSAPPHKLLSFFSKTIPVGISFGVVIVVEEGINFEITTFRKDHPYLDGRHPDGVDFSTPEKDAVRRDFTINGMFYDPLTDTLHDFVGGQEDLKKGIIRAIGNPDERFTEDRLRMIRAVRFSARFGFNIHQQTENAIERHASTLFPAVSMERIWQELVKMSHSARFDHAIRKLHALGLLKVIFPDLNNHTSQEIETLTAFFSSFPLHCPTIVYLLELFPMANLEKRLMLCQFLKTSNKEKKIVEFFTQAEKLFSKSPSLYEWAHFYAHSLAPLFLTIYEAKLPEGEKKSFSHLHQKRQKELEFYIPRIQQKHPLVTASHLEAEGILPGRKMGILLHEAERIAIEQKLTDPKRVIAKLKHTPLWE